MDVGTKSDCGNWRKQSFPWCHCDHGTGTGREEKKEGSERGKEGEGRERRGEGEESSLCPEFSFIFTQSLPYFRFPFHDPYRNSEPPLVPARWQTALVPRTEAPT